jgi:hypothetical protein
LGPVQTIYLDYNCFQRPFDNPLETRIQIEALACLEVIRLADEGEVELVWSFMHEDESRLCPYPDRRTEMLLRPGCAANARDQQRQSASVQGPSLRSSDFQPRMPCTRPRPLSPAQTSFSHATMPFSTGEGVPAQELL